MDNSKRIQEIKLEIEKLQKELRELRLQDKPYTMVSEWCESGTKSNGGIWEKNSKKVSHHRTEQLAIDKIQEIMVRHKFFQFTEKDKWRHNITNIKFTINGKVIMEIDNLGHVGNLPCKKYLEKFGTR